MWRYRALPGPTHYQIWSLLQSSRHDLSGINWVFWSRIPLGASYKQGVRMKSPPEGGVEANVRRFRKQGTRHPSILNLFTTKIKYRMACYNCRMRQFTIFSGQNFVVLKETSRS
jgi:hypothetical protein